MLTHAGTLPTLDDVENIVSSINYAFGFIIGNAESVLTLDWFGSIMNVFTVLFIMVVLSNLLVAIICSVYEKKTAYRYQEYYWSKNNMLYELVQLHSVLIMFT